jgi:rRNA maturation endonuclease Nob1
MKCPACGEDYQNESSGCPVCGSALRLIPQDKKPSEPAMQVLPQSVGVCPDCGSKLAGKVYRISARMAAFLKVKSTDAFVPDKHRCVRKAAAG